MRTIRDLRQARGWTQRELARMVGVDPHTVSQWERGRRAPRGARLRRLGEVCGRCSDEIALGPQERGADLRRVAYVLAPPLLLAADLLGQ
jgi:transcriptional regulator with XRE-family HTH domain